MIYIVFQKRDIITMGAGENYSKEDVREIATFAIRYPR